MLPRISLPIPVGPLIPDFPVPIEAFFGKPTPFFAPIPLPIDFFAIPSPVPPELSPGTIVEIAGDPLVAAIEAGFDGTIETELRPLSRTVSAKDSLSDI